MFWGSWCIFLKDTFEGPAAAHFQATSLVYSSKSSPLLGTWKLPSCWWWHLENSRRFELRFQNMFFRYQCGRTLIHCHAYNYRANRLAAAQSEATKLSANRTKHRQPTPTKGCILKQQIGKHHLKAPQPVRTGARKLKQLPGLHQIP